jgi:hypothetical protein
MNMKNLTLMLALVISTTSFVFSQKVRYIHPVFDTVVTTQTVYGQNATVLTIAATGKATKVPLPVTIYSPKGDTVKRRPLVIYAHTGNFLPFPTNGGTGGRTVVPPGSPLAAIAPLGMGFPVDSPVVEICTRLAKMGYVVAAIDYRTGWNPIAPTQTERVNTLINAAYRGVQDFRTAIRFFKLSAIALGNPFGIDTSKIVGWGQGTGGYITMAAATLDSYNDIVLKSSNKFVGANGLPYVIQQVHGDIYGTSVGINPANGDTLAYINHPGINSDFQLCVNMGGALADTQWIDATDIPMIGYHEPRDFFAPYKEGLVQVPIGGGQTLPVVIVQGTYLATQKTDQLGLNKKMRDLKLNDVITQAANKKNDGIEGLYPLNGTGLTPLDSDPWNWWDTTVMAAFERQSMRGNNTNGLAQNPDMSAAKARRYIDTIMAYYAPRAFAVLGLGTFVNTPDLLKDHQVGLKISPNPITHYTSITSHIDHLIRRVTVYDANGRQLETISKVNTNQYTWQRNGLPTGLYYMQVGFDKGTITKPVLIQ